MILGAHESTAGGPHNAASRAREDGCGAVQIFVKSPRTWKAKPLDEETVEAFHQVQVDPYPPDRWTVHAGYLINLGGAKEELWEKSVASLTDELQRATQLNIPTVVVHPGSHKGVGVEAGIENVARAINRIHKENGTDGAMLLLESMAGAGNHLCARPEEFAGIFEKLDHPDAVGVCLDTCHMFAAGFDLSDEDEYERAMTSFDEAFGLQKVKVWHLNDSQHPLGSNKDRHANIGKGEIGASAFGKLVNDPRWAGVLGVLETPWNEDDRNYRVNLSVLQGLRDADAPDVGAEPPPTKRN